MSLLFIFVFGLTLKKAISGSQKLFARTSLGFILLSVIFTMLEIEVLGEVVYTIGFGFISVMFYFEADWQLKNLIGGMNHMKDKDDGEK